MLEVQAAGRADGNHAHIITSNHIIRSPLHCLRPSCLHCSRRTAAAECPESGPITQSGQCFGVAPTDASETYQPYSYDVFH